MSKARAVSTILIVLAFLYLAIGGFGAWRGWLDLQAYAISAGLVGTVASILGLVSLARPGLTQGDLERVQLESLESITVATAEIRRLQATRDEEIRNLENTRVLTQQEMDSLAQQKKEMEILVRNASLSLFLQEQRRLYAKRVEDELSNNKTLASDLLELESLDRKLEALDQEIEQSANVELLKEIIRSAKLPSDMVDDFVSRLSPSARVLVDVMRQVSRAMKMVLGVR